MLVKVDKIELNIELCDNVYPPSEDSFLLLDALKSDCSPRKKFLEIGVGTGIVSVFCAKKGAWVFGVDIKKEAVECALKNAYLNDVEIDVRRGNLFDPFRFEKFDLIAFNPPYLPSDDLDRFLSESDKLDLIGGETGVEASIMFVKELPSHLEEKGKAFLVVSSLSNLDRLFEEIEKQGLTFKKVNSARFDFEEIFVLEIKKV